MSTDRLLSIKELAFALGRGRTYIWAMTRRGFKMPGGRATLADALAWLKKHPEPRSGNNTEHGGTSKDSLSLRRAA